MSAPTRWSVPRDELETALGLLRCAPRYLRHPIHPEGARLILGRRFEQREADLVRIAREAIYNRAQSPYRALLRQAGCEYGDLERLARREGVEGALRILYQRGVYLTVDEFKGRGPAVRGSTTIRIDPGHLRNPLVASHILTHSSGSRGGRTPVPLDLANVRDRAVNAGLHMEARGGSDWHYAIWGFPGGWPINRLLQYAFHSYRGNPPVRWFMNEDRSAAAPLRLRYRLSGQLLPLAGLLAGVAMPAPRPISLGDPLPVARWAASVLRSGRTPHLHVFVTWAVRLCQAAIEAGIDLRGLQLMCGGEAMTAAKLAIIRQAGAQAVPLYGTDEVGGLISHGCLAPETADDTHLYHDLNALIQADPDEARPGLPPRASLLTALRPTAPLIVLNVSLGDHAKVAQRACGCPLERIGWATHLHSIRSFEKLSAGGMTLLDTDVVRILEEVLPTRFGGGPTDYQLVEEDGLDGKPRLRLLVHPRVGTVDLEALAGTFLTAIREVDGGRRTAFLWDQAGLVHAEQQEPYRTASGKVLHVHVAQPSARLPSDEADQVKIPSA